MMQLIPHKYTDPDKAWRSPTFGYTFEEAPAALRGLMQSELIGEREGRKARAKRRKAQRRQHKQARRHNRG